jgi:hypothetical protein
VLSLLPAFAQSVSRAHPTLIHQRPTVGSVASWILVSTTWVLAALLFPQISEGAPGAIPAAFNVGNQGDAQYTIPIVAPAAAGGLKPNLTLTYDHRAGNCQRRLKSDPFSGPVAEVNLTPSRASFDQRLRVFTWPALRLSLSR